MNNTFVRIFPKSGEQVKILECTCDPDLKHVGRVGRLKNMVCYPDGLKEYGVLLNEHTMMCYATAVKEVE